jgi:hypothetical protein
MFMAPPQRFRLDICNLRHLRRRAAASQRRLARMAAIESGGMIAHADSTAIVSIHFEALRNL